jgi:antirestriction protein ArdC
LDGTCFKTQQRYDKHARVKEELIAEIGAAYLCGISGIAPATLNNQAAYIDSWSKAVTEDKTILISAATEAKQAVNFLIHDGNING